MPRRWPDGQPMRLGGPHRSCKSADSSALTLLQCRSTVWVHHRRCTSANRQNWWQCTSAHCHDSPGERFRRQTLLRCSRPPGKSPATMFSRAQGQQESHVIHVRFHAKSGNIGNMPRGLKTRSLQHGRVTSVTAGTTVTSVMIRTIRMV